MLGFRDVRVRTSVPGIVSARVHCDRDSARVRARFRVKVWASRDSAKGKCKG